MPIPDYLQFKRVLKIIQHSAKGSSWKDHKYIKKENGRYFYPTRSQRQRELPDDVWEDVKKQLEAATKQLEKDSGMKINVYFYDSDEESREEAIKEIEEARKAEEKKVREKLKRLHNEQREEKRRRKEKQLKANAISSARKRLYY